MNEDRHEAYLRDLRARHEREREELRRDLAGRRPRALRAVEQRQRAIEAETAKILEFVGRRAA